MRQVEVGLTGRQLDGLLVPGDGAGQISARLSRPGQVELGRVIVRKQPLCFRIPGDRFAPLLQLRVAARAVEVIGPGIRGQSNRAIEVWDRLPRAAGPHEHLAEIVHRCRVIRVGIHGLPVNSICRRRHVRVVVRRSPQPGRVGCHELRSRTEILSSRIWPTLPRVASRGAVSGTRASSDTDPLFSAVAVTRMAATPSDNHEPTEHERVKEGVMIECPPARRPS